MDLILCHTTADFDTLGAAVGLTLLLPGSKIVLTGGSHPTVRDFLALYRDEYPLIERRSVNYAEIRTIFVVDTQLRSRLGKAGEWLDLPNLQEIIVYDHHLQQQSDIPATQVHLSSVGAVTTLIVEQLQQNQIFLTPTQATVMALGIHADTGSLTFEQTTSRDALALAWLLEQQASLTVIHQYLDRVLSPILQELLKEALAKLQSASVHGYTIGWVTLLTKEFVPGLSSLASQLISLSDIDALLLAHEFPLGDNESRLTIIGRSQIPETNLHELFQLFGGGGHSQAASLNLRSAKGYVILQQLVVGLSSQIPYPSTARGLMSAPVRTIRPETTIGEAQRILLRYGHSGLCIVDASKQLIGIISRRDIDIALHHGFSHAPVKGYMTTNLKTITPETTLPQIKSLMVTYDIGRLPVLYQGQLVGIVSRTDVLREFHQNGEGGRHRQTAGENNLQYPTLDELRTHLAPQWELLTKASQEAEKRGWHLYLVGGAVRDLLLGRQAAGNLTIKDIDLVVDGFHQACDAGAGVEIAKALQKIYPTSRLEIHGAFQTAALSWHKDPLDSLLIDIATARTEFYPYPAANPEVEASSIRQDLYRRDFTINAMALRLTSPQVGELLDFFGGLLDLQTKQIRVLHPNSFIEDPTRIYRAVRFAVRLGFHLEGRTEEYIRYAIKSGIYNRTAQENVKTPALQTRLKAELKQILQTPYWKQSLLLLEDLQALQCIHPTLNLDRQLFKQLQLVERCLRKFDLQQSIIDWQMRLEVMLAHLAPEYRGKVARNLQLPEDSIARLEYLSQNISHVNKMIVPLQPSEVVQLLRQYDLPMLILIAVQSPRGIRRLIWKYLTIWANVHPPLNGNDLRKLGYKPGPIYRQMLDSVLAAILDGKIGDRAGAIEFITKSYPPTAKN